jgi:3-oxoacyl-[acyl-carrier protein] reductase
MKGVALITGASGGIGGAIALKLARDGYAVAVHCYRNEQKAQAICEEIRAFGGVAEVFVCDITDADAVDFMVNEICRTLGCVTVLVNNAGIAQQKLFTDLSVDEWQRMMAIHVDGAFYTCRAVLPDMIRAHSGSIVNISSMWGQTGGSCEVHYSTAKAALIGLTKALAKEVGPAGIRVNCVAPGVIRTDMLAELSRETLNDLEEETPLCRLGTPNDVASAVSFLVSDGAGFITGQVLAPNGGIVI